MRYLVKIGELGEKIEYLEKQLSIIDENIGILEKAKSTIVWQGEAYVRFNENYNKYIKDLVRMEQKILSYIEYLVKFYNNYSDEFMRIRERYIELSNRRMQ